MSNESLEEDTELEGTADVMMQAWGIIANAYEGNWSKASPEWREAAERWRDELFHPWLDENH